MGGGGQECLAICPDIFDILLLAEERLGGRWSPSLSPVFLLPELVSKGPSFLAPTAAAQGQTINHCFCVPSSPARLLCDSFWSGNWELGREKVQFLEA